MTLDTSTRRTVLYGRTSQDVSEGRSVDDQLAELRRWATATGRRVVRELRDDGVSASRYAKGKTRPDWQAAMDLITGGKVDELAVWEISRATRDRAVWSALIAACIEQRVLLVVGGKVHDPADPDDGFMLDLQAALATQESAKISKRTKRAVDSRAADGRPHGTVPYGYRRVLDPDTGRTIGREIHPGTGLVVREIVRRLLAREPAMSVAKDLNRRGIPTATGKEWIGGNLRVLALRPTYAGLQVHNGEVLAGVMVKWPPLVTVAEREQLLAMYADPGRDKFRNSTAVKHLGTGIFKCGRAGCGGVMRVLRNPGRPAAYTCRRCHKVSRNQARVDELVEKAVVRFLSRPDVMAELVDRDDSEQQEAAAEVARLKRQLRELRDKVDGNVIDLDDYGHFKARWSAQLKGAEHRARPRWLPPEVVGAVGPDAAARWDATPIVGKRTILGALFEVSILPVGRGNQHIAFDRSAIQVRRKS